MIGQLFSTSNRAAAFLQLGKEIKAIKDAEQAMALKPDWAKGYFRKGGALVALRRCSFTCLFVILLNRGKLTSRFRWDEAIDVLKKALELEPKSKEISAMLRDTIRKSKLLRICHLLFVARFDAGADPAGSSENGDKRKEDSKGLKLVASDKNLPNDARLSSAGNSDGSGNRGTPIGFSEAVVEQFVRDSLESAINQFAAQGTHRFLSLQAIWS